MLLRHLRRLLPLILSNYATAPISFSVHYPLLPFKAPSVATERLLFLENPSAGTQLCKTDMRILHDQRLSSPQVNSPSCPGLSVEIPRRCRPCFSKRLSSGTFLGANTKPTIEVKKKKLH